MVFVSIFSSIILCGGILFYKYIYPKKRINLFILLLLISVLPIMSIFRPGVYESGDFIIHIYRSVEFYRSLIEGHLLPSWAGGLNATYGYPLFIFNYPLPYYVISFFHLLGFSFIISMKLFLAANFLFSGIFMYLFARGLFKNNTAAFVTAIFYQFVPYHLIDLHFKIAIGEIMIFTFLPLMFYFSQKLWEEKNGVWLVLTSLSVWLLILSHVSVAFFAMILLFSYAVFLSINLKRKQILLSTLAAFILGCLSSIYIWLTPFFLTKYTILQKMKVNDSTYFLHVWELFFSPWRMGLLFQGHKGEISSLLGYSQIFVVIMIIVLLLRKKILGKYKNTLIFWLIVFFILIFFITQYSKLLWEIVPFLNTTGGAQRLLILTSFVSSILAGYLSLHILKKRILLILLIVFTICSTILNWGHRRLITTIDDRQLINNAWKEKEHFYANSKWRDIKNPWFLVLPKNHLVISGGNGEIKELQRISTTHTYIVFAKNDLALKENTLYFPGWQIFDNGKSISAQPDNEGIIQFHLAKGLHVVETKYDDLVIYKLLKIISIFVYISIFTFLLFLLLKSRKPKIE